MEDKESTIKFIVIPSDDTIPEQINLESTLIYIEEKFGSGYVMDFLDYISKE